MPTNSVLKLSLTFAFLSTLLAAAPQQSLAEDSRVTQVGVILPLTGPASTIGVSLRKAMELALEEAPPQQRQKIALHFEDDGLDAARAVTNFNKLQSIDKVSVAVNFTSGTGNAIAPLAEKTKIPLVVGIAADPKIVAGRRYPVLFWMTPETEAGAMRSELTRRNISRFARITVIQEGFLALKSSFDRISANQFSIPLDEEYSADTKDFSAFIAKLRTKSDIQGVMISLMPGQLSVFAKHARRLGVTTPLFGFETFDDSSELKAAEGALDGSWFINNADPSDEFTKACRAKFEDANCTWAAVGHDITLVLLQAIDRDPSTEGIREYLHSAKDIHGAMGTYSATGDGRFGLKAIAKEVRNGKTAPTA